MKLSIKHKNGIIGTLLFHCILLTIAIIAEVRQNEPTVFQVLVDPETLDEVPEEKMKKEIDKISKELEKLMERIEKQPIQNVVREQKDDIYKPTQIKPEMTQEEYEREVIRNSLSPEEFQRYIENQPKMPGDEPVAESKLSKPKVEESQPKMVESKGLSTVVYYLDGRKAFYINVPAYRCEGASKVVVNIVVSPEGAVVSAVIDEAKSTLLTDCYRRAALESANSALFEPISERKRQNGRIEYFFLPQ